MLECQPVARRMALQEYLIRNLDEIIKKIDDEMNNPETVKELDKEKVSGFFRDWL